MLLGRTEFVFELLSRSDVPDVGAVESSSLRAQVIPRDLLGVEPAVPSPTIAVLADTALLECFRSLLPRILRQAHADVPDALAQELGRRVSQKPTGGIVDVVQVTLFIGPPDGISGLIESKPGKAERPLVTFRLRHVLVKQEDPLAIHALEAGSDDPGMALSGPRLPATLVLKLVFIPLQKFTQEAAELARRVERRARKSLEYLQVVLAQEIADRRNLLSRLVEGATGPPPLRGREH